MSPVEMQYDAVGRRSLLTLPGGVSTEYQYDSASRLTALIYRNALGTLGDLRYQYDPVAKIVAVGGTFARTLLPNPVASAEYDAGNQQRRFGNSTLTYDANGNVESVTDSTGSITLTWDSRDRLIGISGPDATASFGYDAFGRRALSIVNGARSEFLYDGVNPVRETFEAAVVANSLGGLGVDEYFARSDSGGLRTLLADGRGSTLALADPSGAVRTEYTFDPFGRTNVVGALNTNPFQYTGRENDGTGLYYYRARYYLPSHGRFVSEDSLRQGLNLYSYVGNDPINSRDPYGLTVIGLGVPGEQGRYRLPGGPLVERGLHMPPEGPVPGAGRKPPKERGATHGGILKAEAKGEGEQQGQDDEKDPEDQLAEDLGELEGLRKRRAKAKPGSSVGEITTEGTEQDIDNDIANIIKLINRRK